MVQQPAAGHRHEAGAADARPAVVGDVHALGEQGVQQRLVATHLESPPAAAQLDHEGLGFHSAGTGREALEVHLLSRPPLVCRDLDRCIQHRGGPADGELVGGACAAKALLHGGDACGAKAKAS